MGTTAVSLAVALAASHAGGLYICTSA